MKTVDVWRASLDKSAEKVFALSELLSDTERDRASRFHRNIDRDRYVVGRAILKLLIGESILVRPELVSFCELAGGKPALASDHHTAAIHFNVSHSGGLALFAFSDHEVGIDLELLAPNSDMSRIAANFFSPDEAVAFDKMNGTERDRFFFRTWVRKEAYVKATGNGFRTNPAHLSIGDSAGSEATHIDADGQARIDHAFKIFDIADMGEHVAAIAVASSICPPSIHFREFTPL